MMLGVLYELVRSLLNSCPLFLDLVFTFLCKQSVVSFRSPASKRQLRVAATLLARLLIYGVLLFSVLMGDS